MNDDAEYDAALLLLARIVIRAEHEAPREALQTILDDAQYHLREMILSQSDAPAHWRA